MTSLSCMGWFSGFRTEFLRALTVLGNSSYKGMFIDSCYAHCQTEMQETWLRNDSPELEKTVRSCIFRKYSILINIFPSLLIFIYDPCDIQTFRFSVFLISLIRHWQCHITKHTCLRCQRLLKSQNLFVMEINGKTKDL